MCSLIREFKLNFDNNCRRIQLLKLRSFNSTFQIQFDNENYSTKRFRDCWNRKYKEFYFKGKSIKVRKNVRQRYFVKKLFPFFKFYKYFLIKNNNFSKINCFIKRNNYIKFISPFLINYYNKVKYSKLSRNLKKLKYNSKRNIKNFSYFFKNKKNNFFNYIYKFSGNFFKVNKMKKKKKYNFKLNSKQHNSVDETKVNFYYIEYYYEKFLKVLYNIKKKIFF